VPARRDDPGEARLWHIGTALAISFATGLVVLAGLAWLAWLGLGAAGFLRNGVPPLHDTIGVAQLVFASVAGAGALVALVVAYRRQKIAEADSAHDRTRVFNERFTTSAAQLGDNKAAVRLAGVHAMAGLADDWAANRQTCIDVLCAYLRMPYEPDPGPEADSSQRLAFLASREVRHTVIRVITAHLQHDAAVSWQGLNFDLTSVTFDGGSFGGAQFSGGTVRFRGAQFSSGTVDFGGAQFSSGTVSFRDAKFSGGTVSFRGAQFSSGTVDFGRAQFSSGTVDFGRAQFSGGTVDFGYAKFSGGTVGFSGAKFSGRLVDTPHIVVSGAVTGAIVNGPVGGTVKFSGGTVGFGGAEFSGSLVDFGRAQFSGGAVDFGRAQFSGGAVNFTDAADWSAPPKFDSEPPGTVVRLPTGTRATLSSPVRVAN
jgi:uncharacterized protein YjbI with pentapeptide repeats